jgi:hypothetical protein
MRASERSSRRCRLDDGARPRRSQVLRKPTLNPYRNPQGQFTGCTLQRVCSANLLTVQSGSEGNVLTRGMTERLEDRISGFEDHAYRLFSFRCDGGDSQRMKVCHA